MRESVCVQMRGAAPCLVPKLGEMRGLWPRMWVENAEGCFEPVSASLQLKIIWNPVFRICADNVCVCRQKQIELVPTLGGDSDAVRRVYL